MGEGRELDVERISAELRIRPEIYVKIVKSFSGNFPAKLAALREALAGGDYEAMRRGLHEIKGTAGNLRLRDVLDAEGRMHAAVLAGASVEEIGPLLEELAASADRLARVVAAMA